jgi:arsenical pump membrane protein
LTTVAQGATWTIAALSVAAVLVRPWRLPEGVWAVLGATLLVAFSLLPWHEAMEAVTRGHDVYLFLVGMMVLGEIARSEGLFDWLAALAARFARGSAERLFTLVYAVGTVTTVFLSNDATAVVLTPAVYAAARAAGAQPLPHLYACAFIANAASFVLPISNPANLVVFGRDLPPLGAWLARFALPSLLSVAATYVALRVALRQELRQPIVPEVALPELPRGALVAAAGIAAAAIALLVASASGVRLGLPTFLAGMATLAAVLVRRREAPWQIVKHVSWSVIPLVAGLFVLVAALERSGGLDALRVALRDLLDRPAIAAVWLAGFVVGFACNVLNNLPAALVAGTVAGAATAPAHVTSALLIGVDLGPNLSVTGSLATILWLAALRREGVHVGAWTFLRVGLAVMPPALLLALTGVLLTPR